MLSSLCRLMLGLVQKSRGGARKPGRSASRLSQPGLFRPQLEGLEDRFLPAVLLNAHYTGLNNTNTIWTGDPDSCGAAGPSSVVEVADQAVALYTSKTSSTPAAVGDLYHFFLSLKPGGFQKGEGFVDPAVVYDDQPGVGRFIITACDRKDGTLQSWFDFAVSKTSHPTTLTSTDWYFFQNDTSEYNQSGTSYVADYPCNAGYNHDAFVFTLNMRPYDSSTDTYGHADHSQVVAVSISDLINGVHPARVERTILWGDTSLRPTVMHDSNSDSDPMWLVSAGTTYQTGNAQGLRPLSELTEPLGTRMTDPTTIPAPFAQLPAGNNQYITVYKMTGLLTSSQTLTVPTVLQLPTAYSVCAVPLQPDDSSLPRDVPINIQKAAESRNVLVAVQAVGITTQAVQVGGPAKKAVTHDVAQWYDIDVSTGAPILKYYGTVDGGDSSYLDSTGHLVRQASYIFNPAIDISPSGVIGMTYMRSGDDTATDYMSAWITALRPGDLGGPSPISDASGLLVPAGTKPLSTLLGKMVPVPAGDRIYTDIAKTSDVSGIDVDPVDGSFWAFNEYGGIDHSWGTAIANFTTDAATHFAISVPASVPYWASSFTITITALTTNNTTATGYLGTIHFASSDPQAGLPSDYTFTAADAGTHTFTISLNSPGTQTITVTDILNGNIFGQASVLVTIPGLIG